MKAHNRHSGLRYWGDWTFWLALSLGPICWLVLFVAGVPLRQERATLQSLFWIALAYPILEEYLFRGALQAELHRRDLLATSIVGLSVANLITSALFAAMHLFNQPPLWAFLVFFPSLVFGWMRDRFELIQPSIILHCIYNAGFVWLYSG